MNSIPQEINVIQETQELGIDKVIVANNALDSIPQEINEIQESQEHDDVDEVIATEHNSALFNSFLETIKHDYENCGPQLRTALEKFANRYNAAKARSIPVLTTFLYDINHNTDPLVRIKSGAKIRLQVESVKRRKTIKGKENDPHEIPARKVRTVGKKAHNLSKNINKNLLN